MEDTQVFVIAGFEYTAEQWSERCRDKGILNPGNACYKSVVLQMLFRTAVIMARLLNEGKGCVCGKRTCLLCALKQTATTYVKNKVAKVHTLLNDALAGRKDLEIFASTRQHESAIFMRRLLIGVHDEDRRLSPEKRWNLLELVGAWLADVYVEPSSDAVKPKIMHHDCATVLVDMPILTDPTLPTLLSYLKTAKHGLVDLLTTTFETKRTTVTGEPLPDVRRQLFAHLPPVLVLNIARMTYEGFHDLRDTSSVELPTHLDLSPYCLNPGSKGATYKLFGCTLHKGATATAGHYIYHDSTRGHVAVVVDDDKVRHARADDPAYLEERGRDVCLAVYVRVPCVAEAVEVAPAVALSDVPLTASDTSIAGSHVPPAIGPEAPKEPSCPDSTASPAEEVACVRAALCEVEAKLKAAEAAKEETTHKCSALEKEARELHESLQIVRQECEQRTLSNKTQKAEIEKLKKEQKSTTKAFEEVKAGLRTQIGALSKQVKELEGAAAQNEAKQAAEQKNWEVELSNAVQKAEAEGRRDEQKSSSMLIADLEVKLTQMGQAKAKLEAELDTTKAALINKVEMDQELSSLRHSVAARDSELAMLKSSLARTVAEMKSEQTTLASQLQQARGDLNTAEQELQAHRQAATTSTALIASQQREIASWTKIAHMSQAEMKSLQLSHEERIADLEAELAEAGALQQAFESIATERNGVATPDMDGVIVEMRVETKTAAEELNKKQSCACKRVADTFKAIPGHLAGSFRRARRGVAWVITGPWRWVMSCLCTTTDKKSSSQDSVADTDEESAPPSPELTGFDTPLTPSELMV